MSWPPNDCAGLRCPFTVQLYSRHMRKHHRAKNTHSVICFLMTQPPHLEESTILMCKEETAWVETRTGCAQRCQAATRWQAVLGWRKKSCQALAESQTQTEVQGQSSKPYWWRDYQIKRQDTEKEEIEHQPVCKAGPGAQGWKHSDIYQSFLTEGPLCARLYTGCWAQRPALFYHRGLRISILVYADKIIENLQVTGKRENYYWKKKVRIED